MFRIVPLERKGYLLFLTLRFVSRVNYSYSYYNIDCSSRDTIHLYTYVRPSQLFLEVVTQAPRIPPLAPRSYTVHPRELEVSGNYDPYS